MLALTHTHMFFIMAWKECLEGDFLECLESSNKVKKHSAVAATRSLLQVGRNRLFILKSTSTKHSIECLVLKIAFRFTKFIAVITQKVSTYFESLLRSLYSNISRFLNYFGTRFLEYVKSVIFGWLLIATNCLE